MTPMKRVMAAAGVLAAGLVGAAAFALPAAAFAPDDQAVPGTPQIPQVGTVGTENEAWYNLPFTCDLPAGCLPVPNVLPDGNLHIGVALGQTTSVSAVSLDMSSLPKRATITEGELSLPIDTTATDLSLKPETAGFKACLLTESFTPGDGMTVAPPSADCAVSNPATYTTTNGPARFVVDLQPFADAWAAGQPNHGLILAPFTTAKTDHSTWQVALLAGKSATGLSKITASLHYVSAASADGTTAGMAAPSAAASPTTSPTTGATATDTSAPATSAPVVQAPAPQVAVPAQQVSNSTSKGFAGKGYAYPIVWLLPVAILAGCAWIGRLLTKEIGATA